VSEAIFDRNVLLGRLRGRDAILREMVRVFEHEVAAMLEGLSQEVEAQRSTGVENAAHKLAGSLVTICAERAAKTARQLEDEARAGDLLRANERMERLREQLGQLHQAFVDGGDLEEVDGGDLEKVDRGNLKRDA